MSKSVEHKCKECGAPLEVVRVILVETTTWREVRCQGRDRHRLVTREEIVSRAEYRRIRARYENEHRKNVDTGIRKMHLAS
jgi:hypothetical protein